MLVARRLQVVVQLAASTGTNQPNKFSETGTDSTTLSGNRVSAKVRNSGAPSGGQASIDVWGMSPSLMNQLSTLGTSFNLVPWNTLTLMAGDDSGGQMSTVFSGTITAAYAKYDEAPRVPFHFECNSGLADATKPTAATSFTGSTDVATIMSGFARQMNVGFENNGVSVKLRNPYFAGNVWTQVRACASHANINAEVIAGKLAIWPKGGNRDTQTVPLIAAPPVGQMVGYPSFTQNGLIVKNVFDPLVAFGGLVQVQSVVLDNAKQSRAAPVSTVLPANGNWAVYKLDHDLDSQLPGGNWMSTIYCYNPKRPTPIAPGPQG